MEKISFTYELKYPVKISSAGKQIEACSVEVFAPTNQVSPDVNVIEKEFLTAKNKASTEALKSMTAEKYEALKKIIDSTPVETEIKPLDLVKEMVMYGADMDRCIFALKNILTAGNKEKPSCVIDVEKMQKPIFDDLSVVDTKCILGLFIQHFLGSSQNT